MEAPSEVAESRSRSDNTNLCSGIEITIRNAGKDLVNEMQRYLRGCLVNVRLDDQHNGVWYASVRDASVLHLIRLYLAQHHRNSNVIVRDVS